MRLNGAKELTPEARLAFEKATEEFYRSIYQNPNQRHRHLQDSGFTRFDTDVTATDQDLDALGNTITYDQSISFVSEGDRFDEGTSKELIMEPLSNEKQSQMYLSMLKEENAEFDTVTGVESDSTLIQPKQSDDSSKNLVLIIVPIVGGLLCCCCAGGMFQELGTRNKSGEDDEFDPDKFSQDVQENFEEEGGFVNNNGYTDDPPKQNFGGDLNYSNHDDGHSMDRPESAGSRGSALDDDSSKGSGSY